MPLFLILTLLSFLSFTHIQAVTVYYQTGLNASTTAASTTPTAAAFDDTVLQAPTPPNPPIPTSFTLQLQGSNSSVQGLSIPIPAAFFGFSIEMSLVTQTSE
jgi:hypothetical protein